MSVLSEKIRRARETVVEIGKFKFTIRRPTEVEMIDFSRDPRPRDLLRHVIGWEGVSEIDLVPGGDPHPLAFDAEALIEWITDNAEMFGRLVDAIVDLFHKHRQSLDDTEKK